MIKCIIFDLDGTLLNTIDDITDAINIAFNNYGYKVSFSTIEVKDFIGSGAKTLILRAMSKANIKEDKLNVLYKEYCYIYNLRRTNKTKPFENMIETLEILKSKGIYLGVLSNKPDVDTKACIEYYFPSLFDVILGQRENIPIKPDPQGIYKILNIVHVSKEHTIYLGDMKQDILTAKNAGVLFGACLYGFGHQSDLKGADYFINKSEDILMLL